MTSNGAWRGCALSLALLSVALVFAQAGDPGGEAGAAGPRPQASSGTEPEVKVATAKVLTVVLKVDKAGVAEYEMDKVGCKDAAALTAAVREKLADLKKTAGFVAVRLVVFDFANVTNDSLKTAERACRDAGAEMFDAPVSRLRKGEPLTTDSIYTIWMGADKGKTKYLLGTRLLEGEAELAAAVKPLVTGKKVGEICLVFETVDFAHITEKELAAAKASVEAAGAKVEKLPELPKIDPVLRGYMRSEGRHANVDVKGVGVRDGVLQFRVGDKLVEGEVALTEALRQRIAEIEKEKGGFTLITPGWNAAPELEIAPAQTEAVWKAIKSAVVDPEGFFGYRDGGGRRKVVSRRSWSFPVVTFAKVNIIAPAEAGNRYMLGDQTLDGEKTLTAALGKILADSHKGQEKAEGYFLSIKLAVEVKPGITATEEQIERARATIKSTRLEAPPMKYVFINSTATDKYAIEKDVIDGDTALIAKVKELAADARNSGRMLYVSIEMAEGASVSDETAKALRKICLDSSAEEKKKEVNP